MRKLSKPVNFNGIYSGGLQGSYRRPWQVPTQPSVLRAMYRASGVGSGVDGGGTAMVP